MGIFSAAVKFVKKVFTAPRQVVAMAVKTIGSVVAQHAKSVKMTEFGIKLEEIGDAITPKCYREEEKTVKSVVDVGKDCKDYFNMAKGALTPSLESCCNKQLDHIYACKEQLQWIVPENVFVRVKAVIPEKPFDGICKSCWDEIAERISTDNKEFVRRLGIEDALERRESCKVYVTDTVNDIAQKAAGRIDEKTADIVREMVLVVKDYMSELEIQLADDQIELEELQTRKEDSSFVQKRLCERIVDVAYLSCVCNITYTYN